MTGQHATGRAALDAGGKKTSLAARARRFLGLVAVAAALAFLLGGLAGTRPRRGRDRKGGQTRTTSSWRVTRAAATQLSGRGMRKK